MDKEFYRFQVEAFLDYASKQPDRELLSLFNEWAYSKDIYGVDKQEIWTGVRQAIYRTTRVSEEIETVHE